MNSKPGSILGIGAPIIDYIIPLSEEAFNDLPGGKEGMERVEFAQLQQLLKLVDEPLTIIPGGSSYNTTRGLAGLGWHASFAGKIGRDNLTGIFRENMGKYGIIPLFAISATATTQVACLVSPSGKRTFRTYFGAGYEMEASDLQARYFTEQRLVHIEGYSLCIPELPEAAAQMAKQAKALLSFDLGSYEIVAQERERILQLIVDDIDILFSNLQDMETLTGLGAEESCRKFNALGKTVVVTMGAEGCWVGHNKHVEKFPVIPIEPVDTTGAGDLFAAGFLDGFLQGKPMSVCAAQGALLAGAVIQIAGAELPADSRPQF